MMEEKKKISKAAAAQLQEHFDQLIPRNLFLVKQDTYPDRVYRIAGSTAVKNNITIAFKITEDNGYVCEYFLDADGYTEHRRYFMATDQVELLENYEALYDDEELSYEEHMRIVKHNKAIRDLLVQKGFIKGKKKKK
ncbi:hypothetical protein [uncultured Dokdonia sp.]|uniref:hypothetical protein n=1 Tax=uncultured Dokdonia sp. TaxID=575653 RepID=UPI0026133342|nr:hypothetical protein [uncultured Dokdonia sp.]